MRTLSDLLRAVSDYQKCYRHPALPPFEATGLYDLFPGAGVGAQTEIESTWPDPWPMSGRHGVYAVLDPSLQLLYVGKASQGYIGSRLSTYFGYDETRTGCRVLSPDGWSGEPRFVLAVAVPHETPFEASALEEYLIRELQPRANTIGVARPAVLR